MIKKRVTIFHGIIYALFLLIYYSLTKNLSSSVAGILIAPIYSKIPLAFLFVLGFSLYLIIDLILPVFAVGILFYFFIPEQYHKKNHWRKCFLKFVLPGEIIRFLISFVCLGHQSQIGGRFSKLACFLFENTYMIATKRHEAIRNDLEYIPADFFVFALWYLLYAAVYGILIALVYRFMWQWQRANPGDASTLTPQANTSHKEN